MEASPRPDILLAVLDAARADRIGCYGRADAATPVLDSLARSGVRHDQAIATSCWTLESVASLLTGLYPADHGAHFGTLRLPDHHPTLPERLRALGYRTLGVSANSAFVGAHTGLNRGFHRLEEVPPEMLPGDILPLKDSAGRVAEAAEMLLRPVLGGPEPIFLYLHLVDTHLPYCPPIHHARPFLERIGAGSGEPGQLSQDAAALFGGRMTMDDRGFEILGALYEGALGWMDETLGRVLDLLRGARRPCGLLTVATADHGEHLGEGGMMDHAFSLSDILVRVPLIISWPDVLPAGVSVEEQVQPLDLFSTIVERLEGPGAADRLLPHRRGLLPGDSAPFGRPEALAQYTEPVNAALKRRYPGEAVPGQSLAMVRAGGWKLVLAGDGSARLFNLADDPGELKDLGGLNPERAAQLRACLPQRMLPRPDTDERAGPADPELVRRLALLGYL